MAKESREVWAKRVERWKDSGLTAAEYAAEIGISARALKWWRWRLTTKMEASATPRERRTAKSVEPITFVEVAPPPSKSTPIEVVLARGCTVRVPIGFDAPTFERLLGILERSA